MIIAALVLVGTILVLIEYWDKCIQLKGLRFQLQLLEKDLTEAINRAARAELTIQQTVQRIALERFENWKATEIANIREIERAAALNNEVEIRGMDAKCLKNL